jgi:aminoglycoside 6'-N-acetyltransferase
LIAFTEVNCNFGRRGRYWVGDRPGVASLDILLLDAAKRGQGHGRRIVEDVSERVLRLPGIKRVSLDPHPSNRAAIRAYRYAGFTPLGLYRNMEAEPGYILVRDRAP